MVLDLQAALELQKRESATDWYEELGTLYGEVNEANAQAWELFRESEDFEDKIKALKAANRWTGTATSIIEKGLKVTGAYNKGKVNPVIINQIAAQLLETAAQIEREHPDEDFERIRRVLSEHAARRHLEESS